MLHAATASWAMVASIAALEYILFIVQNKRAGCGVLESAPITTVVPRTSEAFKIGSAVYEEALMQLRQTKIHMRRAFVRLPILVLTVMSCALASAGPNAAHSVQPAQRAQTARGFANERLTRVERTLQQFVDDGRIAGVVVLVLRDGHSIYERALGWRDKEAGRRMTEDTIFRIASQTKAITSVALLSLVEEGKVALNDPVSRFIPEFAHTTVVTSQEGAATVVPAKRPITIRDLLTHTAGISYGTDKDLVALYEAQGLGPAAGYGWYTGDKDEPICQTMKRLASLPFAAQPGEAFVYGYNTDVLGCVIEQASGVPLDEFVRTRITEPLGMSDTHFFLPAAKGDRLAAVYSLGSDARITRAPDGSKGQGSYVEGPRRSFSGGAGLLSTAHDYARFLEMIRNGGALGNVRILAPRTVRLMTTNQTGSLYFLSGMGFGLGFGTTERFGASGMEAVGSFGWSGAYGTWYRVDPEARLVMVFMIQRLPNADVIPDLQERFSALVYQSLLSP